MAFRIQVRTQSTVASRSETPSLSLFTNESSPAASVPNLLWLMPLTETLDRYRVKGGGPRYLGIGKVVRYARVELLAWVLSKRRDGTPEA